MRIRWSARPVKLAGGGTMWVGTIDIDDIGVAVQAKGNNRGTALTRAAVVAKQLAGNPAIAAILPPGGAAALNALGQIASSKAAGKAVNAASAGLQKFASWLN